jgi:hypothetical protein
MEVVDEDASLETMEVGLDDKKDCSDMNDQRKLELERLMTGSEGLTDMDLDDETD